MKTVAAFALFLLTMAPAHAQNDFTGKWVGTMTRTLPDGRTAGVAFIFQLTQKDKELTGTAGPGPEAERQWKIEKGTVDGTNLKFQVQQPDGPLRTFTVALTESGRLQGEMLAELNGQSFTAKVDAGREKGKDAK